RADRAVVEDLPRADGALDRDRARGRRALLRDVARQPALGGRPREARGRRRVPRRDRAQVGGEGAGRRRLWAGGGQRSRRGARGSALGGAAHGRAGTDRTPAALRGRHRRRARFRPRALARLRRRPARHALHRELRVPRERRLQTGDRGGGREGRRFDRAAHRCAGRGVEHALGAAPRPARGRDRPLHAARPPHQALDAHALRAALALVAEARPAARRAGSGLLAGGQECRGDPRDRAGRRDRAAFRGGVDPLHRRRLLSPLTVLPDARRLDPILAFFLKQGARPASASRVRDAAVGALHGFGAACLVGSRLEGWAAGVTIALCLVLGAATALRLPTWPALARPWLSIVSALVGVALLRSVELAFFALVPLVAAAVAGAVARPPKEAKPLPRWAVPAVFATAATAFFVQSANRHWQFASGSMDLGIFVQQHWLLSQGLVPFNTVMGMHMLADHMDWIDVLIAPFLR